MFVSQLLIISETTMKFKNLYLYLLYCTYILVGYALFGNRKIYIWGGKKTLHINSAHDPGDICYRYDDLEN